MSLDCYLAVCRPLHYETLRSGRVCSQLLLVSWLAGFFWVLCPTILMASLPFCGPNGTDHFFCDSSPLLRLSCGNTHLLELVASVLSTSVLLGSLTLTSVSYACILTTVLRSPTAAKRKSILHLCLTSHSGDHHLRQLHFPLHSYVRGSIHAAQQRCLRPELYHHTPPNPVYLQPPQ